MSDDPLSDLLLDADEVDRASLARALNNLLGVDSKSGRVILKPGYQKLTTRKKVLAYLLGIKVSFLLGKIDSELVAPKEIPGNTDLPRGTVYPKLKELREANIVTYTDKGEYYVANHNLIPAINDLQGGIQE